MSTNKLIKNITIKDTPFEISFFENGDALLNFNHKKGADYDIRASMDCLGTTIHFNKHNINMFAQIVEACE